MQWLKEKEKDHGEKKGKKIIGTPYAATKEPENPKSLAMTSCVAGSRFVG